MTSWKFEIIWPTGKLTRFSRRAFSDKYFQIILEEVIENDEDNHPEVVSAAGNKVQQGKGYSAIEDLLDCKAFIAASEDQLKGTSQKGKALKLAMHKAYKRLLV